MLNMECLLIHETTVCCLVLFEKKYSRINENPSRNNELLSRYNEVLSRINEKPFSNNENFLVITRYFLE